MAETDWNETMVYDKSGKAHPYDYDWMFKPEGMKTLSQYADGIGPWKPMIVKDSSKLGHIELTDMVKNAHANGMVVHPYTFRADKDRIPTYVKDYNGMLEVFYNQADVDGVFTDFPDKAVSFCNNKLNTIK